ncbi:MAG: hypothetical protein KIT09_27255 [Bryobacteraceae bacterium]|nr:hypothetical protein [Bryobacteraceae bacterium]
MSRTLFFLSLVLASSLHAQSAVTRIKLYAEPAEALIRPLENAVVQVRVYGKSGAAEGRLLRDGAKVRVVDAAGGWISKPFKFQGADSESFIQEYDSRGGRIFQGLAGQYVVQDSVLYTAPDKPGAYRIEASLNSFTDSITIRVDAGAPSRRKAERTFPPEPRSTDPYRALAEHYAPFLAQETWFQPKADYATRFDYDGDWNGANNWESLDVGTSQAYVHYAAAETVSHWFLIYNVFHPRDYSDKCVAGSCHENDNEGLILTVAKDNSRFGRLQAMETLAHNNVYSFVADKQIRRGAHDIDGEIELYQGARPVVFIESGGHGIYGSRSKHARYDLSNDRFTAGTGVTYVYKGTAERPRHADDRLVGYELLDIYSQWWLKCNQDGGWRESTFDAFFAYQPLGGRPGVAWRSIGGSFLGRAMGQNLAKPFWGWHDSRTSKQKILAVGQWGLDPAYAVTRNLTFPPGQVSLDYVFNPYLALPSSPGAPAAPPAVVPSPPAPGPSTLPAGARGWFEFRVWVDAALDAFVSGDQARLEALRGTTSHTEYLTSYSEPFPSASLTGLRLVVKEGRGRVQLVEQPSAQNGFSARVRIDDPQDGGAVYHIALEWER